MAVVNQHRHQARTKAISDAVAGSLAALVSLWVFYPIDVIKINAQAGRSTSSRTLLTWTKIFAGLPMKTFHTASSNFCYFYLYSWIFSWWVRRRGTKSSLAVSTRLLLSAIAAMGNTALTLPLDVIAARQQTSSRIQGEESNEGDGNRGRHSERRKTQRPTTKGDDDSCQDHEHVVLSPLQKILSLWKGLLPSLLLCSNPSIHYTVFDVLKARLLQNRLSDETKPSRGSLSMVEAFCLGLFAKFVATMATYPLIRAKVLMMVTGSNDKRTLLRCVLDEYKSNGIVTGLYRGCQLQLFHTLLKSALLMMLRERITTFTRSLIVGKE